MLSRPQDEADRALLPIRIMVDLFGPIVDISTLTPFRSIDRARYLTATELAQELNSQRAGRSFALRRWTERRVHQTVSRALSRWANHRGLIDLEVLKLLLEAEQYGAEIAVVSTVPDAKLFELAVRSIKDAAKTNFPNGSDNNLHFFQARPRTTGRTWNDILRSLADREERYTYVLHDHSPNDVGVDEQLFDEWVPRSSKPDGLLTIIHDAFERAERRAPLPWLSEQDTLSLSDFTALGKFLVFDQRRRRELQRKIDNIRKLVEKRLVCVYLSGGPGSGKSFFVEQYGEEYSKGCDYVLINLAPTTDFKESIQAHINDIVATDARVAFIDEVDTLVGNGFAFRFLQAAMSGDLLDGKGRPDRKLHSFTWFMAGSAGKTRDEVEAALFNREKKVADFLSRLDEVIELPGVTAPFEAMLQSLSRLKREMLRLREVERRVLLFFATVPWADAREVSRVAELVGAQFPQRESVSVAMVDTVLVGEELSRRLEWAAAQSLEGYVRIS